MQLLPTRLFASAQIHFQALKRSETIQVALRFSACLKGFL
jgi:hypothetical protein